MGAARVRQARVGNLPVELTSLVGRVLEVTEARRLLESARLLTLTGPGGVGKTRLALRVADVLSGRFDGRVWLVELAELSDPALLPHTVAAVLDVADPGGGDITEAVLDFLSDERALLVLDNCEHLVDAVAKLVSAVLGAAPEVSVLATGREPVGITSEVCLAVPPLPVPDPDSASSVAAVLGFDSVKLLVERAQAVVPSFAVDEANYAAVARLCAGLDGIPLAIELAAVRLRSLSVQDIVNRLGDRYRLLNKGRRGSPARHQTLQATIEWSYELCTATEQALWAQAALFAGGFDLDAAEAVLAVDDLPAEAVLDVLASLVDKSILVREAADERTRYVMLQTLRDFGLRRLADSEPTATRRRHRDFYAELAESSYPQWWRGEPHAALTRVRREHGNLRAALQFCLTEPGEAAVGLHIATCLRNYWATVAPAEGARWLDRLLAAEPTPNLDRVSALTARAGLPIHPGSDAPGAGELLAEAKRIADELAPEARVQQATILRSQGILSLREGRPAEAVTQFVAAGKMLDRIEPVSEQLREYISYLQRWNRSSLSLAHSATGDYAKAESLLRDGIAAATDAGAPDQLAAQTWNLGLVLLERGEVAESVDLARRSLRTARDRGHPGLVYDALQLMASIATAQHKHTQAARLFGAAADLAPDNAASAATEWETSIIRRDRDLVRQALGDHAYDTAYQSGARLATDDAITLAIDGKHPATDPGQPLTKRETEIAELVAQGRTNRQVADQLVISVRTAETHVDHILTKLGFANRAQLAAWIVARNTVPGTESHQEAE